MSKFEFIHACESTRTLACNADSLTAAIEKYKLDDLHEEGDEVHSQIVTEVWCDHKKMDLKPGELGDEIAFVSPAHIGTHEKYEKLLALCADVLNGHDQTGCDSTLTVCDALPLAVLQAFVKEATGISHGDDFNGEGDEDGEEEDA